MSTFHFIDFLKHQILISYFIYCTQIIYTTIILTFFALRLAPPRLLATSHTPHDAGGYRTVCTPERTELHLCCSAQSSRHYSAPTTLRTETINSNTALYINSPMCLNIDSVHTDLLLCSSSRRCSGRTGSHCRGASQHWRARR